MILISRIFIFLDRFNDCIGRMQLIRIKPVSVRDDEGWGASQCHFLANQTVFDLSVLIEINRRFGQAIMREI